MSSFSQEHNLWFTSGMNRDPYLKTVDISQVSPSPFQPRKMFNPEIIGELVLSIKSVGLIHPPTVRALESGRFEIISGEMRWRAAYEAGWKTIPVIVQSRGDREASHMALIENIHRIDLSPVEVAKALSELLDTYQYTQEELAIRVGKKRSTIANYLRLLHLPEEIQEALAQGLISMGHAKAILMQERDHRMDVFEAILKRKLSVREAEKGASREERGKDPHLKELERGLGDHFGRRVVVSANSKHRGKISLIFNGLEDFDVLLKQLGAAYENSEDFS